ncbi:hypothetical protein OMCYN_01888 [cyanobiont of Ornithocercus magnificus]|nr:hypothetical protein OMCYN_01888 [cyanobiont of Ornithocercus magnificus]
MTSMPLNLIAYPTLANLPHFHFYYIYRMGLKSYQILVQELPVARVVTT